MAAKYPYKVGDEPVPGYRVIRFLGKGNFGEVWHAKAPGGASVAMKIIPDLRSKQAHKEFRALGITKDLHHPNLVPVNAVWLKDGEGMLLDDSMAASPLLPSGVDTVNSLHATISPATLGDPASCELIIAMGLGHKSLFDRLQECREQHHSGIPLEELLGYMEESAKAIDYLNNDSVESGVKRLGVQHCDIKPHNILIAGTSAQVCDFGLARVQGEVRGTTTLSATVAYAAPECLEKTGDPSPTTDQYSLAVSYYELRTGQLPFDQADTLYEVMNASLAGKLDFSAVLPAEQAVLRRATARDPAQRFPSALAMVKALRRATDLAETVAMPKPLYTPPRPVRILAAIVLTVGSAAVTWWATRPDKPQSSEPTQSSTTSPAQPSKGAAMASTTDVATGVSAPDAPTLENLVRAIRVGNDERAAGQTEEAIKTFTEGINQPDAKAFPEQVADALVDRGACYRDLGGAANMRLAQQDFNRALELVPQHALALSRRGYIHLKNKDFEKALADLNAAIAIEPHKFDLLNRAIVFSATGKLNEAMRELNDLVASDAKNSDALYQRALIHRDQMDYLAAEKDLRASLALDATQPDARANLALILVSGPHATPDTAIEGLELAMQACQNSKYKNPIPLDALAAAWAAAKEFDLAVQTSDQAIAAASTDPAAQAIYRERQSLYRQKKPLALPAKQ